MILSIGCCRSIETAVKRTTSSVGKRSGLKVGEECFVFQHTTAFYISLRLHVAVCVLSEKEMHGFWWQLMQHIHTRINRSFITRHCMHTVHQYDVGAVYSIGDTDTQRRTDRATDAYIETHI